MLRFFVPAGIFLGVFLTAGAAAEDSGPADVQLHFRWEATTQAVLSTEVDSFWDDYALVSTSTVPMGLFDLVFENPNRFEVGFRLKLQQQFVGWQAHNLTIPVEGRRSVPVESHLIDAGYLRYDFDPLQVTFGRTPFHSGPLENSLMISKKIPFVDQIGFYLPMGEWRFDYAVISPETRVGKESAYTRTTFFVTHRLGWAANGWSVGLVEQALLDRNIYDADGDVVAPGQFTLTDFLPVFSYHQGDIKPFNTMIAFDAEWILNPGWRWMAQLGFDDIDASMVGIPDDPIPTIWAFILGTELKDTLGPMPWSWYIEIGATHALWGNFWDDSPGAKAIYRIKLDNAVEEMPLTSPYGPGAGWVNTRVHGESGPWQGTFHAEFWMADPDITLGLPYADPIPFRVSRLVANGRFSAILGLKTGDALWSTGPGVLVHGSSVAYQWNFKGQWILE